MSEAMTDAEVERDMTGELLDAITVVKAHVCHDGTTSHLPGELVTACQQIVPLVEQLLADYTECWHMLAALQQFVAEAKEEGERQAAEAERKARDIIVPQAKRLVLP
jgi:hypothetical protein